MQTQTISRILAIQMGREVLTQTFGRWVGVRPPVPLAELGIAAQTIEQNGGDWRGLTSPEAVVAEAKTVVAKAEAIRTLATDPLVRDYGIDPAWLLGADNMPLGINGLASIQLAIRAAESLGIMNWTAWPQRFTAVHVIDSVLPQLAKRVKEKQERALLTVPPGTPEPAVRFTQGLVLEKDGVPHVVCTGYDDNAQCLKLTPVSEAHVGPTLGSIRHALGVRTIEEITTEGLASKSFCPKCAERVLKGGSQTISEALIARDDQLAADQAAAEKLRQESAARRAIQDLRRKKAKLAACGGAAGDLKNPKPRTAKAAKRRARQLARSSAAMRKGSSNATPQKSGGKGKKGK